MDIHPVALLVDASANNANHTVIRIGKSLRIPTISILDFFGNYDKRFTERPDYIIVPNQYVYEELCALGYGEDMLLPLGNPLFEWILSVKPVWHEYYQKYLKQNSNNVLFISQCFKEDGIHPTQEEVFENILNDLKDARVIIKPHPREDKTWIQKYHNYNNPKVIELELESYDTVYNFMSFCNKVVGINSTVLYVARLLKLNVHTIELNGFDKIGWGNPKTLPYPNAINNNICYLNKL